MPPRVIVPAATFEAIFQDILTLGVIDSLKKHGVSKWTFYQTLETNPLYADAYSRALRFRTELLVDEIPKIAKECEDPNRARVEIDALKWYASKMEPKKYSDRIDLTVTHDVVNIKAARENALQRASVPLEVISSTEVLSQPHSQTTELDDLLS